MTNGSFGIETVYRPFRAGWVLPTYPGRRYVRRWRTTLCPGLICGDPFGADIMGQRRGEADLWRPLPGGYPGAEARGVRRRRLSAMIDLYIRPTLRSCSRRSASRAITIIDRGLIGIIDGQWFPGSGRTGASSLFRSRLPTIEPRYVTSQGAAEIDRGVIDRQLLYCGPEFQLKGANQSAQGRAESVRGGPSAALGDERSIDRSPERAIQTGITSP